MTPHRRLLADYAEKGSQEAFQELVNLYIGMVHASAVRLTDGDVHRAQDIVQTVFADLARHAGTISEEATLGGWLHRRTCHVAATMMRSERRRQHRERQAVEMNALHEEGDEALRQVAPVLDEAIDQLNAQDRHAIMLRFFERCDLRTIGEALGSNEDAVQKRITRALDKLRMLLAHRGVVLSGTALALALSSQAASAAPVGLAVSVSAGALTAAQASTGFTFTTVLLTMTKLKITAIAVASALILAGGVTTVVVLKREKTYTPVGTPDPQKILQEAQADAKAGKYPEALAKQVWFHENALKYQPNQRGVRLSFALMYWDELSKKYPPALKKLQSIRDQAEKTVRANGENWAAAMEAFIDCAGINRELKEDKKTTELFIWLDAQNPTLAKKVFHVAEAALIRRQEYKVYGRYIDGERSYGEIVQTYSMMKSQMKSLKGAQSTQFAGVSDKSFSNRAATLVAVLAITDRKEDADRIATKAAKELNDPAFIAQLDEAKNGVVPEPWP